MYDNILLFIKLLEVGSFSKLANLTGTSQPTLSRKIQALEEELEVKLLFRTANNIRPTESGKLLYDKFKHHEVYLNESIKEIRTKQAGLKGVLRVALPSVISKELISPFIGDFLKAHPLIDLIISYKTTNIEPAQEGIDIAITIVPPKSKNSATTLLQKFKIQLYASPNFLSKYGPITKLDQAIRHSTIGYLTLEGTTVNDFVATHQISGEETHGVIAHPRIYIDNFTNIAELASSGEMMITAWDSIVQKELASGDLIKILPEYSFREICCYLVRPSLECSALQHAFIEFIEECFARQPLKHA